MATSISINGVSYSGLDEFQPAGVVTAGIYYALPPLGAPPEAGEPIYTEHHVHIPGRAGSAIVRDEFVQRILYVDMVLIYALASLGAARKNFLDGLRQLARFTISLPDNDSYQGCRLVTCGRPNRTNIANGFVANVLPLVFEQLSTTN